MYRSVNQDPKTTSTVRQYRKFYTVMIGLERYDFNKENDKVKRENKQVVRKLSKSKE